MGFFYHSLFRNFLTSSTWWNFVSSPVNLGDILSSCLPGCIRIHFLSSVNKCSIYLAEIVSSYKLLFKMKCTGDRDMLTALAIFTNRAIAILFNHCPDFWNICPVCYSHRSTRFFWTWRTLYLSEFLNCLIWYRIRPINIPQFSKDKKCLRNVKAPLVQNSKEFHIWNKDASEGLMCLVWWQNKWFFRCCI